MSDTVREMRDYVEEDAIAADLATVRVFVIAGWADELEAAENRIVELESCFNGLDPYDMTIEQLRNAVQVQRVAAKYSDEGIIRLVQENRKLESAKEVKS